MERPTHTLKLHDVPDHQIVTQPSLIEGCVTLHCVDDEGCESVIFHLRDFEIDQLIDNLRRAKRYRAPA